MKSLNPPRLAVWLLEHFGPEINSEALAGDLCEDFRQGRSNAWYWRQVMAAIQWRRHFGLLLVASGAGWLLSSPAMWRNSSLLSRPLDMAVITAVFWVALYLPGMLRGALRALLVLLSAALFLLLGYYRFELADHYLVLASILVSNLVFHRKEQPPPSFRLTFRELLRGDLSQERQRLLANLECTMEQESNPELQQAYAQAILVLESNEPPITVKRKQ